MGFCSIFQDIRFVNPEILLPEQTFLVILQTEIVADDEKVQK